MAKYNNFMFSVPNLPRPVYDNVKRIGEKLNLSHQQIVILGVAAIMKLSWVDKAALDDLVKSLNAEATMDVGDLG